MADLQTLINAIPDAQDGNVITSDYHNTIKTALAATVGQLGGSTSGQTVTVTLPANFLPVTGAVPNWNLHVGYAGDSGSASDGWIPLSLPQGVILKRLVAIGLKNVAAPIGSVNLLAVAINGTDPNVLASISLSGVAVGNPFTIMVPAQVVSSLAGLLTVDNTQFKYVIEAKVNLSTAADSVTLYSLQVAYTTP